MDQFPPFNLNARPFPPTQQPAPNQISVQDLIQIRIALDSFAFKSKLTSESIGHLDTIINSFISTLNFGAPKP